MRSSANSRHESYNPYQSIGPTNDANIQLVPCRWSNTGWKYVQNDPIEHGFFNSPNRVNSHGFGPKKQLSKSVTRNAMVNQGESVFKRDEF